MAGQAIKSQFWPTLHRKKTFNCKKVIKPARFPPCHSFLMKICKKICAQNFFQGGKQANSIHFSYYKNKIAPMFFLKFPKLLNQAQFKKKYKNAHICNFLPEQKPSFHGVVAITLDLYSRILQFKSRWVLILLDILPQHSTYTANVWGKLQTKCR